MSKIVLYPANDYDFDAADVAAYLAGLTSGVFSSAEDFPVTAAGGLKVTVGAGRGWVHPSRFTGYSITKRESDTLTMPLADPSLPRIDRIVMRYDAGARAASLQVLQGTASSTPTAPAISRTELIYDLCRAEITRPAAAASITTGQITDTRLDESLCGVMRDGVTGIPTAQLLQQAQARINALEEQATSAAQAADRSQSAAASSQTAAAGSASAAAKSASSAQQASLDAANSASGMTASVEAAAKSADAAAKSQTAAAASAQAAQTSAGEAGASAEKAAEEARKAANYVAADKTLSISGAPADAATVGNIILDRTKETLQPIFYAKSEVDKLLEDCKEAAKRAALLAANPVGKLWVSDDPTSPASIVGGTWERIEDCTIWGASDRHPAGTTVDAGLPNLYGQINGVVFANSSPAVQGTLKNTIGLSKVGDLTSSGTTRLYSTNLAFSSKIRIADTVQPPAYCMYIWRRVA